MMGPLNERALIFVVDDEPANLKLLGKLLGGQGYQRLVLIQDSRLVMDHYRNTPPDLILLDINMPYLDGYQVMEKLQTLNDPLLPPIVILTAQLGHDHMVKALTLGARDFVAKPFDREELLMRVRNLLDAQLAHRLLFDQKQMLEAMVRARTEALNRTRLQIIRRLGRASEYRDNETGLHIIRMSQISALLAARSGWNDIECELMLLASPMHDVGKIGIPDAILLKAGKLAPEEWETMKRHTLIGADILDDGDSDLLRLARVIALTHHEKWDGSGYPQGLSGDAIPHEGRIAAVADVFDALMSSRPYKKAWPADEAIRYVIASSGTHFDPEVVTCFESCLREILDIQERHREPPKEDGP